MVLKTYKSELWFNIEHGQDHDINIRQGNPPLPTVGETTAEILKSGLVIFHWNIRIEPIINPGPLSNKPPDWISLELYKPKGPYDNPDTPLFDIPPPPNNGDETVRADDIGGQSPTKEHSNLWKDYINVHWEYVSPFYRLDVDFIEDYYKVGEGADQRYVCRKDSAEWPGPDANGPDLSKGRSVHHMRNNYGEGIYWGHPWPFRVAECLVTPTDVEVTRKLLVLLLIKRMGRLRLKAWHYVLKIHLPRYRVPSRCYDCFIATAAYGSPFSPEVQFLREVRDGRLKKIGWGKRIVEGFESLYYTFSPKVAYLMTQKRKLKKAIRWLIVAPIIHLLSFIMKVTSAR